MKKRNAKLNALLDTIILMIIFSVAIPFNCKRNPKEIKIGAILPLTGNAAKYGTWTKEGMELAAEEINSQQKGIRVKILFEDDGGTPQGGVNAFNKLIKVDKVSVVTGVILSQVALALAPIAEKNKIILLSTGASSEKIKDAGDYVFRIRESSRDHGKKAAEYALTISKQAGVIFLNAENGISYADEFKKHYEDAGGKIVLWEKYNEGETDFRSYLSKMREGKLKVVYIPGLVVEIAYILKQAKEMGISATFISSVGAENPKLLEIAGEGAEGLVYTYPFFDVSLSEIDARIKKFVDNYIKKYGHNPDFLAANGYDGIMLLAEIIRECGYNTNAIKKKLYETTNFPGIGGEFSFDEYGEVTKPVILKHVKNKEFQLFKVR
ncbi:MAG: ABC transporter substrate-binding protein [candidate division WOR-3 bacterium]